MNRDDGDKKKANPGTGSEVDAKAKIPQEMTQFLGPIEVDTKAEVLDHLHTKIERFLDSQKPNLKSEFQDGFEAVVKGKPLKRSLAKLGKLSNYQDLTLYALTKEVEPPTDQAADGAGDAGNPDPAQND